MELKDFLNNISHSDLKKITRQLNLHTVIKRYTKLTKDELVNAIAERTKLENGKLMISIPMKELEIPTRKEKKERKKTEKKVMAEMATQTESEIATQTESEIATQTESDSNLSVSDKPKKSAEIATDTSDLITNASKLFGFNLNIPSFDLDEIKLEEMQLIKKAEYIDTVIDEIQQQETMLEKVQDVMEKLNIPENKTHQVLTAAEESIAETAVKALADVPKVIINSPAMTKLNDKLDTKLSEYAASTVVTHTETPKSTSASKDVYFWDNFDDVLGNLPSLGEMSYDMPEMSEMPETPKMSEMPEMSELQSDDISDKQESAARKLQKFFKAYLDEKKTTSSKVDDFFSEIEMKGKQAMEKISKTASKTNIKSIIEKKREMASQVDGFMSDLMQKGMSVLSAIQKNIIVSPKVSESATDIVQNSLESTKPAASTKRVTERQKLASEQKDKTFSNQRELDDYLDITVGRPITLVDGKYKLDYYTVEQIKKIGSIEALRTLQVYVRDFMVNTRLFISARNKQLSNAMNNAIYEQIKFIMEKRGVGRKPKVLTEQYQTDKREKYATDYINSLPENIKNEFDIQMKRIYEKYNKLRDTYIKYEAPGNDYSEIYRPGDEIILRDTTYDESGKYKKQKKVEPDLTVYNSIVDLYLDDDEFNDFIKSMDLDKSKILTYINSLINDKLIQNFNRELILAKRIASGDKKLIDEGAKILQKVARGFIARKNKPEPKTKLALSELFKYSADDLGIVVDMTKLKEAYKYYSFADIMEAFNKFTETNNVPKYESQIVEKQLEMVNKEYAFDEAKELIDTLYDIKIRKNPKFWSEKIAATRYSASGQEARLYNLKKQYMKAEKDNNELMMMFIAKKFAYELNKNYIDNIISPKYGQALSDAILKKIYMPSSDKDS